jgi:hypothetical protein
MPPCLKDGATTLKFYAHYINSEAMTQLKKPEEQNISHLGKQEGIGSVHREVL